MGLGLGKRWIERVCLGMVLNCVVSLHVVVHPPSRAAESAAYWLPSICPRVHMCRYAYVDMLL